MREIAASRITETVKKLCIEANCYLPKDVQNCIEESCAPGKGDPGADHRKLSNRQ